MIDFLINLFSAFYNALPDSFIQNADFFKRKTFTSSVIF